MVSQPMLSLALAGLILAGTWLPVSAADLDEPYSRRTVVSEDVVSVIVVPDCWERPRSVLLACAPREAVDSSEVQALLSTVRRPRRTPYPQLLDRP